LKRKALVLVFSNLKHDARVTRQVKYLTKNFEVAVVAFDGDADGYTLLKIDQTPLTIVTKLWMGFWLFIRQYKKAYQAFHSYQTITGQLAQQSWDLIVANDIDTLPMAFEIKGASEAKVIFDAHEYSPRHFENRLLWRIFFQPFYIDLCKKYIPKIDAMLTVGKGLAAEYHKNFGKQPTIITNATRYFEIEPQTPEPNKIKLVHHGIANPSRRLDLLLEMMKNLDDRFTLDLILMTSDFASGSTRHYIENLKAEFQKDGRIKILPSVKSNEVVPTINKYDIGIFLLPPINFNYENTLPNKLFDFIQARLAIAIGPTPEMAEIVNRYDIGVVSPTFDPKDLATALSKLSHDQLKQFKHNTSVAAQEQCAEKNEEIFEGVINQLFNSWA
jgi:glycosyltransferase involved in cell wall biosynthesis